MTTTPEATPAPEEDSAPKHLRTKDQKRRVNYIAAAVLVVGILLTVAAMVVKTAQEVTPPIDSNRRLFEQGQQWAQGYLKAVDDRPKENVLNSLAGACILQMNSTIATQYNNELSQSWLSGCLSFTASPSIAPSS